VSTIFILLVFAYFVIRFDVSVIEKLVLLALIAIASMLPLTSPATVALRVACAIAQGIIGVYIVFRMHYLKSV
jgi:hypothetical protein